MSVRIWEATEADLLDIIKAGQEESPHLEYKSSAALANTERAKTEISKDVSAFANSEGGTIIYGISETRVGKQPPMPRAIDEGIDPAEISKEWIENVINSRIHRRIDGVKIHQIPLTNTRPNKVAYVVWVPQSHDAPHQAHDKRYYKRFNFQSVPMEDYEIRDVRNRRHEPSVIAEVAVRSKSPFQGGTEAALSILLRNIGNRTAQQVYIQCDIPSKHINPGVNRFQGKSEQFMRDGTHYRQLRYHHRDESGPLPLFPGTDFEVLDGNHRYVHIRLLVEDNDRVRQTFIYWVVYADGAQPNSGQISFEELFLLPK